MTTAIDPFAADPMNEFFTNSANIPNILPSDNYTQHLQLNYARPTLLERIRLLVLNVPPHKVLAPRKLKLVEVIMSSLELEPDQWKISSGNYYLEHIVNGTAIWVSSGSEYIRLKDNDYRFTPEERNMVWTSFEIWKIKTGRGSLGQEDTLVSKFNNTKVQDYAKARTLLMDGQL